MTVSSMTVPPLALPTVFPPDSRDRIPSLDAAVLSLPAPTRRRFQSTTALVLRCLLPIFAYPRRLDSVALPGLRASRVAPAATVTAVTVAVMAVPGVAAGVVQ